MTEIELTDLLKQHSVCKIYVNSQVYANNYFDTETSAAKNIYEARLNVIESLVKLLEPSNEYTIMKLHYINRLSVNECAECMRISLRTGFRLLKNGRNKICKMVNEKGATDERAD